MEKKIYASHTFFTTLCLFIFLFSACKKDEPTPEEMLTGGSSKTWKYYTITYQGQVVDMDDQIKAIRKTFNKNGTMLIVEGANTNSGYWKLIDNNKTLREAYDADFTLDKIDLEVRKLTTDTLHLYMIDSLVSYEWVFIPAN